jgi:predicted O-methyltransferase YrrM
MASSFMSNCELSSSVFRSTPLRGGILAALVAASVAVSACQRAESARVAEAAPPDTAPAASPATAAGPRGQVPADVATLLASIKAADKEQLAVSEEDGQFLRMLVASTGRRRALEIGAASGYSAIWIGMAMRETGGTLVTIEYDPTRAREAAENVRRAGLDDIVRVVPGDAFQEIPKLAGTFDCIFVDAWKRDYIKFFEMTWPRLDRGGLFLGHNVINKKSEMTDFLDRIATHPDLYTSIVAPAGEGISISYKRR